MTPAFTLTRRLAIAAGVSIAFAGRAALGAEASKKLVVIIARGAMDGLSVSPPVGDANYQALRGPIAIAPTEALMLDGTFGLHPKLAAVHALAKKGQARIAPAVAIPNNVRSHFEAQDVLESGGSSVYGTNSGWLNRTLTALSAHHVEGLSIGAQAPLILRGPVQAASWSPGRTNRGERLPMILADLYKNDPILSRALASGLETEAMADLAKGASPSMAGAARQGAGPAAGAAAKEMGRTVAGFMTQAGGPQIVAISIDGWDAHANQGGAEGQLANRLAYLDGTIDGLASGLGGEWNNTVVLVVTEFGRTARVNGTRGTDHGTASTALVLGGDIKRGGIIGDWPTLADNRLFENRDLAPSLDIRAVFKGVLTDHLGIERRVLDTAVFPDSAKVAPVMGLV